MTQTTRQISRLDSDEETMFDEIELLERERDMLKAQNVFLKGIHDFHQQEEEQ